MTDKNAVENLYVETYKERLTPNKIKEDGIELKALKEYLFKINLENAKENKSEDWSLKDLEKALRSFKNNKSRDELGHTYELFKYGGIELKMSLLRLLNKVKRTQIYPTIFRSSNISSI